MSASSCALRRLWRPPLTLAAPAVGALLDMYPSDMVSRQLELASDLVATGVGDQRLQQAIRYLTGPIPDNVHPGSVPLRHSCPANERRPTDTEPDAGGVPAGLLRLQCDLCARGRKLGQDVGVPGGTTVEACPQIGEDLQAPTADGALDLAIAARPASARTFGAIDDKKRSDLQPRTPRRSTIHSTPHAADVSEQVHVRCRAGWCKPITSGRLEQSLC